MAEKTKAKELIYSNQAQGFEKGRRYSNPRFFSGAVRSDITSVIVVGDWPAVVDAYKRAGVPVKIVAPGTPLGEAKDAPEGSGAKPTPAGGEGGGGGGSSETLDLSKIDIPSDEELADMDWTDLRKKVKELNGTVTNKEDAKTFIAGMRAKKDAPSE